MSEVIKLLDTVDIDINDTIQHVENISENNLETKNSYEQMSDLPHFEITNTMERLI